jgi:alkylhydroperoxidase family enzyme
MSHAALTRTEALANLPQQPDTEAAWNQLQPVFDQQEIINLTATISVINAWNRIGVGFNFLPATTN